jgi:ABC-type dipeptide/oligopeptide/nickel transport system permease component
MLPFIIRRLFAVALLVVGISLVTFTLVRMVPGDPAALYYGGMPVSADVEASLRRQWGLDHRCRCSTSATWAACCGATWACRWRVAGPSWTT